MFARAWPGIARAAPQRGVGLAVAGTPRGALGHRRGIVRNLLPASRAPSLRRRGQRPTDAGALRATVAGQCVLAEHRSPVPGRSTLRDARGIATPNAARLHNRQNPAQYTTDRATAPPEIHTPRRVVNACDCQSRATRSAHRATTAVGRLPWCPSFALRARIVPCGHCSPPPPDAGVGGSSGSAAWGPRAVAGSA